MRTEQYQVDWHITSICPRAQWVDISMLYRLPRGCRPPDFR